jgi:bis(5'-nucleosyl)-tetraphosphatase (symmetrical)
MATYVIGDIQGCYRTLMRLLDRVGFRRGRDRLWLVGDLVNRGPRSLEVLRFCADLGDTLRVVLGNHDLHLCGRARGVRAARRRDTLDPVLAAADGAALCAWLSSLPLCVVEEDWVMVHAGLLPSWSIDQARALAREAEAALAGPAADALLAAFADDGADQWRPDLFGPARVQTVLNAMTRMRVCDATGRMLLAFSRSPAEAPAGSAPWFTWPAVARGRATLLVGHWGALGLYQQPGLIALDGGCVWGRQLVALRLEDRRIEAEAFADG